MLRNKRKQKHRFFLICFQYPILIGHLSAFQQSSKPEKARVVKRVGSPFVLELQRQINMLRTIIIFIILADEITAQLLADLAVNCVTHLDSKQSVHWSFHLGALFLRHILRQMRYYMCYVLGNFYQLLFQLSTRLHSRYCHLHLHRT